MKKKIFLDFDGTTVNSIKAFCSIYNWGYAGNPKFKHADWRKVNKWDFSDECLLAKNDIESIFAMEEFFTNLEVMDVETLDVIDRLKDKFDIVVCSIGTPANISHKVSWIERVLDIKNMIMLSKKDAKIDKSIINMGGGIIIDDHSENLFSSNAETKICFGEVKEWNENWSGLRARNWKELEELLINKI